MEDYTVPLATAQSWAHSWQNNPPKDLAKGFLIQKEALEELLAVNGVVNVRAYMGETSDGTQKLMFVGVDQNGRDLIDASSGHYVYDHTTPCPPACDPSSPLFDPK